VLTREVTDTKELLARKNLLEYNDKCRSDHTYRLEQCLVKVKEYLII